MAAKLSKHHIIAIIFSVFATVSCVQNPDFADVPELTYMGLSKGSMDQNSLNTDSLFVFFHFTDGDGDFGSGPNNLEPNIVITDTRTGETFDSYRSPEIPPQGASKGIEGEVTLRIFTTCCLFPDNIPPCEAPPQFPTDELVLEIYITDRSGNRSNTIQTEPITIFCK